MPFLQDKRVKDKEASDAASTGMKRAGEIAKKKPDTVKGIQDYAMEELRKQEEEKKKKKKSEGKVETAPSKGILQRMYESVMGSSEKK